MTDTQTASATTTPRFSPEFFAAFWAAPSMSHSMDILADDIIGYWPGDSEPVRGFEAYTQKIADILAVAPDLKLELVDSATAAGPPRARSCSSCTTSGAPPGRTGPSRSAGWTGFAPVTASSWRT